MPFPPKGIRCALRLGRPPAADDSTLAPRRVFFRRTRRRKNDFIFFRRLRAELRELGLPAEIVGELTERRETEILVTND